METNSVKFFKSARTRTVPSENKLILAVWKIMNPGNAGQIIRLGHNVGAERILFIGNESDFRKSKIKKTAGFSFEQMEWEFITEERFLSVAGKGFALVALETCSDSTDIFRQELPDRLILVAGSESSGIPGHILQQCHSKVHIPMPGGCKSMNVSHALSVAAFEWYRQKSS